MRIPEELKSRIFTHRRLIKHKQLKLIIDHMLNGIVLELIYAFEDEEGICNTYIETAPICLIESKEDWYLFASGRDNKMDIYNLKKIKAIGRHWITFSLPKNIDYNRIVGRYFDMGK